MARARIAAMFAIGAIVTVVAWAHPAQGSASQNPPVPRPFPGTGSSAPPTTKPTEPTAPPSTNKPAAAAPQAAAPADATAMQAYVYPGAEFLTSFDAGRGQRYYLFGTNTAFAEILVYYKNVFKNGGRELLKTPPMQQFDLGRFDEDTMAFPPSVVVKDYTWNSSPGYLWISGTTEKRFRTIIQVVPPAAGR
jgi:hypothetical protein